ncbi:phosphotransferase [Streptomyces sp. AC495_CC817]|uniref:phosphotransferase n=1 Tax=Streptomyces sp. AC495_CC817 TaxID=2823900 RepID=UPI001C2715E3|nr:phosphotransferase [Streptomyces sp. AC495_CC817]
MHASAGGGREESVGPDVVVKAGRSRRRAVNEALHYLAMDAVPPPFRTARLIAWSAEGMMLKRLDGAALGAGKILEHDVPAEIAQQCLDLALATSGWESPVDGHRFDYRRQLDWGCERGLLAPAELDVLREHERRAERRFQHGDLIPSNVIVGADGAGAIDFEWSGRTAVNGLDWATLLVNGWNAETLRSVLLGSWIASTADGVLNWASVICHELRQVERDGGEATWAREARDLYTQQLPLMRAAVARVMR